MPDSDSKKNVGTFLLHMVLSAATGCLVYWMAMRGYGIHVPYLVAVLSGVGMGWLQPRKGWLLTLLQVLILGLGFALLADETTRTDLAKFSVFGSIGLVLVGGLLGGVLKRNVG